MKLLIVYDSSVVRRKIERSVMRSLVEVVGSAANGRQAIEIAAQKRPDIVTLDLTMPEMDGLQCIDGILEIVPHARILVISALADKATALETLKKGAQGFLCKPFSDDELNDSLVELIYGQ